MPRNCANSGVPRFWNLASPGSSSSVAIVRRASRRSRRRLPVRGAARRGRAARSRPGRPTPTAWWGSWTTSPPTSRRRISTRHEDDVRRLRLDGRHARPPEPSPTTSWLTRCSIRRERVSLLAAARPPTPRNGADGHRDDGPCRRWVASTGHRAHDRMGRDMSTSARSQTWPLLHDPVIDDPLSAVRVHPLGTTGGRIVRGSPPTPRPAACREARAPATRSGCQPASRVWRTVARSVPSGRWIQPSSTAKPSCEWKVCMRAAR